MMKSMANTKLLADSIVRAFGGQSSLAVGAMARCGLMPSTDWTPLDTAIDSLQYIGEKVGANTVRQIGRNVARLAGSGVHVRSVSELYAYMNHMYHSNHLRSANTMGFGVGQGGHRIDFFTNPYPYAFNWGLAEGFVLQSQLPYRVEGSSTEHSISLLPVLTRVSY